MSGELAIMRILLDDTNFSALVGGKIFYNQAPQGKSIPFTVIRRQSTSVNQTKNNNDFDFDTVEVWHTAGSIAELTDISTRCRNVLEGKEGIFNSINVAGLSFQWGDTITEKIEDKIVNTEEQLYQVITRL